MGRSIDLRYEWEWMDHFIGASTFSASATTDPWVITDTSSAGTPTYTRLDHGETTGAFAAGVARLAFDNQNEAQNVCLSFGDKLAFDINKLRTVEYRVQMGQAAATSGTSLAFGVTGDRNDAIDSIAIAALFRVIAADSTTALVVETDDGVADNDDVATGATLINAWQIFRIDFTSLADVKFYVGNSRVASGTTFDMTGYSAALQPFVQLQKTATTATDNVQIDYVYLNGVR